MPTCGGGMGNFFYQVLTYGNSTAAGRFLILKVKTPRYRVFKNRTSSVPVFSTNWKFLAQCYVSYFCKNYARIEKFVGDKYQTVLEIAYAIVVTNN